MTTFSEWLTNKDRSRHTVAAYIRTVRAFADWSAAHYGTEITPATLTRSAAREWLREREAAGASPATLEQALAALRCWVAWATATGELKHDPLADEIKLPKQQDAGPRWLPHWDDHLVEKELERRRNARLPYERQMGVRDWAIYCLMRHAGLRVSEVCSLVLDGALRLGERSGDVTVKGKGSKVRTVPLNVEARKAVEAWLAVRPAEDSQALFLGKRGEALQPRAVERSLEAIGRAAGVKVTPHQLRHTCAKTMLNKGAKLTEVQSALGHENIATTTRYVKPSLEDLRVAMERMV